MPIATLGPAVGAAIAMVTAVVLPRPLPEITARPDQRLRSMLQRMQRFLRGAVDQSVALIRAGDLLRIGGALGYFPFDVASLGAAFEALGGGELPLGVFLIAYVLGHGGAMLPLPGSAEGGLVGAFALYGSPLSLAVGAVLVHGTFHAGVPVLLGTRGLRRHPATTPTVTVPRGDRQTLQLRRPPRRDRCVHLGIRMRRSDMYTDC